MAHSQRSTFQHSDEFWSPGIQAGFALMGAVTLLLIAAICWAQRESGDESATRLDVSYSVKPTIAVTGGLCAIAAALRSLAFLVARIRRPSR